MIEQANSMIEQSIPVMYVVFGAHRDTGGIILSESKIEFTKDDAVRAASGMLAAYADDSEFYVMIAEYNWASVSMYVNDYGSK